MAQQRPTGGVARFAQEAWQELSKVTWPTFETVGRLTVIVLVISTIIALYILGVDNVFTVVVTRGLLGGPETTLPPQVP